MRLQNEGAFFAFSNTVNFRYYAKFISLYIGWANPLHGKFFQMEFIPLGVIARNLERAGLFESAIHRFRVLLRRINFYVRPKN